MIWEGYQLETGDYHGHSYGIVFPKKMAFGKPYVWRTEFFGAFPSVDLEMLKNGYAVVYYRISDLYGSLEAVELMAAFQPFIQWKYRLSAQTILFGFSRGGLYALHYAAKFPERIAALYLDAPVVDIYSWPGGFFSSEGSFAEWEECKALWNKERSDYIKEVDLAVKVLQAWSIPLALIAGGNDKIVPYNENGAMLQTVYEKGSVPFLLVIKPECGHHPHSLDDPRPVAEFLMENRACPSVGNAFRINDQSIVKYPLTLIVHDREHLPIVMQAEQTFGGKYPLGYIGTSPWPGSVTNQSTMNYNDVQNRQLYDLLKAQMKIGWVIYGQCVTSGRESEFLAMVKDIKENCPEAKQMWIRKKDERFSPSFAKVLEKYDVLLIDCNTQEEIKAWLKTLTEEIERSDAPCWFDSLEREWAEWTNLSITMPKEEKEHRILLVGDSISAGYGSMVQEKMLGWHVDRLNTSEGIHHPNFLRLLEIALKQYPYQMIHINNGIHVHGQDAEQYKQNLMGVFFWIHTIAPKTKIVFATTTPLSRKLNIEEQENFNAKHFSMGDKAPMETNADHEYWVTDEKASEVYRELNEKAKELCKAYNIPVNDLYQLCVSENLQKSDGVHFQEKAYRRLAEKIVQVLQKELEDC